MPFLESLKHAFAVESADPIEPTEEQRVIVERLCAEVVHRRLTVPALLALEMSRPLGFLAAQAIHFFTPLISAVTDADGHRHVAAFLERRQAIEYMCRRIEQLESEQAQSTD
jgi:hypothetical protein